MNKQQKQDLVKSLEGKFLSSEASFLVSCQGLSVGQMQELRFALHEKGAVVQVAKNRLVKLAIKNAGDCSQLDVHLQGQLALIFTDSDITGTAKVLYDFSKNFDRLGLVAGCGENQLFDVDALKKLAKLPSREVLLAQLMGVMQAPTVAFVIVLRQLIVKMLLVLKAIAEKKENK